MFGEEELGTARLGSGAVFVLDPGPVPGYEAETAPLFRTVKVPAVGRTFVVPASDRYADLSGRVGGFTAGSQLDFRVDWRAWLQGDVVIGSYWTDALGDRVEDAKIIEAAPEQAVPEQLALESVTYGGELLTDALGDPYTAEVIHEDTSDGEDESQDGSVPTTQDETRVGTGTIRSGVTSIIYEARGTSPVLLKNAVTTARGRKDERTLVLRGQYLTPMASFEQDPGAVLDYRLDFSALVESGERLYGTIDDMLVFGSRPYFALSPGMTFVSRTVRERDCIVWLRGGIIGNTYLMSAGFNTSSGKTVYGQFAVTIKEK